MRRTKAEQDAFKQRWLLERMAHKWSDGAPTVCTLCSARYTPTNTKRRCPKRRKPNRWRIHLRRAELRELYPHEPPKRNGAWIRAQILEIERQAKHRPIVHKTGRGYEHTYTCPDEQAWWKYSRDARRYRRLVREYWALPTSALPSSAWASSDTPDRYGAWWARQRNKLLEDVRRTQARTITREGTTYTFVATAKDRAGCPLFPEEYGL